MDLFTKKRFEALLHSARENLIRSLESLRGAEEEHTCHGEPMDEADVALLEHQRETLQRVRNRYRQLYWEVENALKRLRDGDYGFCDNCGDPINPERLVVQPTARLCIDCQKMLEKRHRSRRQTESTTPCASTCLGFYPLDSTANPVSTQWRYPECIR
ncbi:MAG: TraR/DksA family transcriptional regulator [Desulfosoma sp.]